MSLGALRRQVLIMARCRRGLRSGRPRTGNDGNGRQQADAGAENKIICGSVGSAWDPQSAVRRSGTPDNGWQTLATTGHRRQVG